MITRWILTASTITLALSCSTSPELENLTPAWESLGLEEAAVHSIHERSGKLYAGTDQGVYISASSDFSSWNVPKLDIEGIQYISLVLDAHQKIIAAAHYWPDFFDEENRFSLKAVTMEKHGRQLMQQVKVQDGKDSLFLL